MTPTSIRNLSLAAVIGLALVAGCAKKPPAPAAAPPQPATQPSTTTPPPATTPAPEKPSAPTSTATVGDLKTVYFALDSSLLDDAARSVLDANARLLRDNSSLKVRLEGNCDERGTVEYNQALGQRRAEAVRDYLAGAGVDAGRLTTISYGKEYPVAPGHDESAWSQNRRVDFADPSKSAR